MFGEGFAFKGDCPKRCQSIFSRHWGASGFAIASESKGLVIGLPVKKSRLPNEALMFPVYGWHNIHFWEYDFDLAFGVTGDRPIPV